MIADSGLHRGRDAQGLMNPAEIVPRKEYRNVRWAARPVNTVVWYLNSVVQGVRDFENADEAREWAVNILWTALPVSERCHH